MPKERTSSLDLETETSWFPDDVGGLALALEPISVILDFLPFLGSITRGITTASTFIIALVMSSVTILVSILLHNLLLLAIAILVAFGLRIVLRKINYSTINS